MVRDKLNADFEHFVFSYYPLEFILEDIDEGNLNSNNILLGNSSFLSNNHFEALEILSEMGVDNRKIVAPLSYGDLDYAKEVAKVGKSKFNERFIPIMEFMPLQEYNKLLKSCNVAIFNNYRQQAIGNTITLLWMGSKVYLDERNTFYQFLKRKGIHVFSVNNDLNSSNINALKPLTSNEIKLNREILLKELSSDVLLRKLHFQIESIANNSI